MASAIRQVTWRVRNTEVKEKRVTDKSPDKLGEYIWSLSYRDYPITSVAVDGKDIPKP